MEAVAYTFDRQNLPKFSRFLHLLTVDVGGVSLSRKEFAARLTKVGFKASDANVSQWMNEERTPPPGLPYYAAIALDLDSDQARDLAWSYTATYKDNRKGAGKASHEISSKPGLTEENRTKIEAKKREWDEKDRQRPKGSEGTKGNLRDAGDRV